MAFGVKVKNVVTQEAYSLESLLVEMKKRTFTAGEPSLTKNGAATIITFPALDSQNQVAIMKSGFGEKSKKFSIQKQEEAGVGNMISNMAKDAITGGFFGFGGIGGKTVKRCEELVDLTAKELGELNL